ncbi:hypothetical protein Bhyg_14301 [Pseudolycoriella hygida]|uniref:Uncharacterized protein n=1 Tax=Pseudolycoriella hygida TaxID=35572 RepID=A0A9Q0MRB4_9DIPT|nr:hypothetical protein Bhyg_14301 [Pseudolycoriella hygida]
MKIFVILAFFGVSMADVHRSKRFLIFPPTSPTRVQLIAGIGFPVTLDYESVTFGYVLKAEYFLPDNTTLVMHFMQSPFDPITRPITSRRKRNLLVAETSQDDRHDTLVEVKSDETVKEQKKYDAVTEEIERGENNSTEESNETGREHYEKYDAVAVEIERGENNSTEEDLESDDDSSEDDDKVYTAADYRISKPNDFSTARWSLFKGIEMLAERNGLVGRACMLRSICESAYAPFSFRSGILGELMHIILTPSTTKDTINDHSQNEYHRAEALGKSGAPCEKIFKECTRSLLDQFTGIYGPMENIIKFLG